MRTLTTEEKAVLKHVIEQGINALEEIQQIREALKEDVKAVSETLEVKPKLINKAIKTAFKRNLGEERNVLSEVEEVLVAAGKKI